MHLMRERRQKMNGRERFIRTFHYEPVDRIPLIECGAWGQTFDRWEQEGSRGGAEAARDRARELLASHEVPPLPREIATELDRISLLDTSG